MRNKRVAPRLPAALHLQYLNDLSASARLMAGRASAIPSAPLGSIVMPTCHVVAIDPSSIVSSRNCYCRAVKNNY